MSDKTGIHTNMKYLFHLDASMVKCLEDNHLNVKVIKQDLTDGLFLVEVSIVNRYDASNLFWAGARWAEQHHDVKEKINY